MDTIESLGYVKGLMDGLDLDENKKETKVFNAIIDVLENICEDIEDLYDEVDSVNEDLSDLEDIVYDGDDEDWDDVEEYTEFEIECPNCGEIISVDEFTVLESKGIECPNCGEKLEFEIEFDDEVAEDEE